MRTTTSSFRPILLGCGIVLLLAGVAFTLVALRPAPPEPPPPPAPRDLKPEVENLRANGAIVENYHILRGAQTPSPQQNIQPDHRPRYRMIGAILMAGGVICLMGRWWLASNPQPPSARAGNLHFANDSTRSAHD